MIMPSIQLTLPVFNKKKENKIQKRIFKNNHHPRTTSAPSILPSYSSQLSLDVLLDAIELDQKMRECFRNELLKSKNHSLIRRRSKSVPIAPPSYHHLPSFSSRWITNDQKVVTTASEAQKVAQLIVKEHFEKMKSV
ncbi:hypothetical protein G6F57_009093 [Rhizopus arrhizus]|uniref:Uncharacterized protein n=1 Tax=Rhizopus oryzae TaxID=64495 RepID=A0A9P6X5G9_RHIOR|nr:hypothetical protein G6F23_003869 [Rhizopus arrhizus]KAG1401624.1 hypothetical protein G6F58_010710 [Rhizopus delemar]KAG0945719.1 hypothetical protein G6F30_004139 [Rhizopus arrhizus]KAG0984393.1 hypothetical protein G6F29_004802 [Rhizopus arrhizus]KAG0996496.1 hypothetical protein G6F28_003787 [Rhizopus arrhizus]